MKLCSFFTGGPLLLTIGVSIFGLADSMTLIVSDLAGVGQFHFMRSFLIALMVLYLAKFFKLSLEEFEKITDNNFFNLFTKAKRDNYL